MLNKLFLNIKFDNQI